MPGESAQRNRKVSGAGYSSPKGDYDPFVRGGFPVGVRTIELVDERRDRVFPCEIWHPAAGQYSGQDLDPQTQDSFQAASGSATRRQAAVRDAEPDTGIHPLIVFSHSSGSSRRAATFLCTHLSSHGYVVSALDHSEVVAPELRPRDDETAEERKTRAQAWIANRVPDIRILLDRLTEGAAEEVAPPLDQGRIGIIGHSFGGWSALAATTEDRRIGAVVALAPAGNSNPRPGILPVSLTFDWGRNVPTLYLVAENDMMIPLQGMLEIFERTKSTKQMVILRRADHSHFADNVEQEHEALRALPFTGELEWINKEMRPISELASGEQAHLFVRGLTVAHMDAYLLGEAKSMQFLASDLHAELARRDVEILVHKA